MTVAQFLDEWNNPSITISVETSGSTGAPKTIFVEKRRMLASAKMTCDFLGLQSNMSALLCMSLKHIGAKMMVVRSLERGMRLMEVEPNGHPMAELSEIPDFAAMVPLQVYNTLNEPAEKEKLMQIQHLIIGGGAIDAQMQEKLKDFPHHVWSTYGMTETLSHIALRRLNGPDASDWYQPFANISLRKNEEDCLCITAPMLCKEEIITNDCVEFNDQGHFRVLGRKDNVINSGGIKIQIEEVEHRLKVLGMKSFAISSVPDEKFGEIVVLLQQRGENNDCLSQLPKYWQPKRIVEVDSIPLTENGKIARHTIKNLLQELR